MSRGFIRRYIVNAGDPERPDSPRDDHVEFHAAEPLTSVYVLLDAEACQVKIGISEDVERRVADLSRIRGRPLDLIGTMRGGYDLERAMHGRFREFRREGQEWYSSEILGDLEGLLVDA
jgi:hypothetical protein